MTFNLIYLYDECNLFMRKIFQNGFTLIELLIVISIISVLAMGSAGLYSTSLQRGRDAKRKGDLNTIQKGLEQYYDDKGSYPPSYGATAVRLCNNGFTTAAACTAPVYLITIPKDPNGTNYYYTNPTSQTYQLYSTLDRTDDTGQGTGTYTSNCGGQTCRYGVSSTNTTP